MTVVFSGQTITAQARAVDPVTRAVIPDATGTAYFYAPPKNPETTPADRTPDFTLALTFDDTSRLYLGSISTSGWPAGTWWVQGVIQGGAGGYDSWSYASFPVEA